MKTIVRRINSGFKNSVYCGRPSKWGNPFSMKRESDRARVIQQYENWIKTQPKLLAAIPELKGKVLECFCYPKACHCDVLAALANK